MCLSTRKTNKELATWLKTQPDEIIAYKAVRKCIDLKGRPYLSPLIFLERWSRFKRKNRIRGKRDKTYTSCPWQPRRLYEPYFHLWLNKPDFSRRLLRDLRYMVIKCTVPKELVTALGTGNKGPTIIAKGFDIRSKHYAYKKYFGEK